MICQCLPLGPALLFLCLKELGTERSMIATLWSAVESSSLDTMLESSMHTVIPCTHLKEMLGCRVHICGRREASNSLLANPTCASSYENACLNSLSYERYDRGIGICESSRSCSIGLLVGCSQVSSPYRKVSVRIG